MIKCQVCGSIIDNKSGSHMLKFENSRYIVNTKDICVSHNYDTDLIMVCDSCITKVIENVYKALNLGKWHYDGGYSEGPWVGIKCSKCGKHHKHNAGYKLPSICPNNSCKSRMDTIFLYDDMGNKIDDNDDEWKERYF